MSKLFLVAAIMVTPSLANAKEYYLLGQLNKPAVEEVIETAGHADVKCTPVRSVVASVVDAQPVRSAVSCVRDTRLVKRLRGVRPVKRLFGWVDSVK